MLKALSAGVIGVRPKNLEDSIDMARRHGFEAVEVNITDIADRIDSEGGDAIAALFTDVVPAGWGLPLKWSGEESEWREGLAKLPRLASAAEKTGAFRSFTWIVSGSNDREYEENLKFHVERFRPVSEILGEHGCSFGLEFLGPKTIRDLFKYPFAYKALDMLEVAKEIGPNMGLLLDSWHWYTSGGTIEELLKLSADDVVYVHVNDAPAGIPVDEQIDNTRGLPGETGVIDIAGFLKALHEIEYEGPIVAEPFKKELNDLPSDEARLEVVAASMTKIMGR